MGTTTPPEILAPAGNKASFLAAVAAGADAVYCGLKEFSARMEARNFSLPQLRGLTRLAHEKGRRVYVTLNGLIKTDELDGVGKTLDQLARFVEPDGVIVQDLALVALARQTGFPGEIHLSTLANVGFEAALSLVRTGLDVDRVVIPRELDIDEVKRLARSCPEGLSLEMFVHGALCYGVSGRCYWSSFLGGKSGLRGRCVQPCRRIYRQQHQKSRFFSCQDLSLDVLVKVLLSVPQITTWKIEGRKKGPHYVTYTVAAYRMLRDEGKDPKAKKEALRLLDFALGRPGTHYFFLPQRPQQPVKTDIPSGSGFLIGRVRGSKQQPYIKPVRGLLAGDIIRLGYEDAGPRRVVKVKRAVPKKGRLDLKPEKGKGLEKGAPVFLLDRREKELQQTLDRLEGMIKQEGPEALQASSFKTRFPERAKRVLSVFDLHVFRSVTSDVVAKGRRGYWLSAETVEKLSPEELGKVWWWLPPVVWPSEESALKVLSHRVIERGGKHFVVNAPWQTAFFHEPHHLNVWAGPFCNISNPLAVEMVSSLGCAGTIVSPELGKEEFLALPNHSPIPLGVVLMAHWPVTMGRASSESLVQNSLFTSPKGEQAWSRRYGDHVWVYPNWVLNITGKKDVLKKAGYALFVHLHDPVPPKVAMKKRPGLWNWDLGLK